MRAAAGRRRWRRLINAKKAASGLGWSGDAEDPEGNVIGLWQSDESAM